MPIYTWKDRKSGTEIEVLRRMDAFDVPPAEGEDYEVGTILEPDWERLMPNGTSWAQCPGYRAGGKGSKGGFVPKTTKRMPDSL